MGEFQWGNSKGTHRKQAWDCRRPEPAVKSIVYTAVVFKMFKQGVGQTSCRQTNQILRTQQCLNTGSDPYTPVFCFSPPHELFSPSPARRTRELMVQPALLKGIQPHETKRFCWRGSEAFHNLRRIKPKKRQHHWSIS